MYARLWGPSRRRAVWLCNQEAEEQPIQIYFSVGSAGSAVPWFSFAEEDGDYNMLLGRPIIPVEYCQICGTPGDLIFVDLNEYGFLDKLGITSAQSIHVQFLSDQSVFRFTWRLDGAPLWHVPVAPFTSSAGKTLSPYVVLAQR